MAGQRQYRPLTDSQIKALESQGCFAGDWSQVEVTEGFTADRIRNVEFGGQVRIGDDVRIANVGGHLSDYDIGDGVCIENVGTMEVQRDSGADPTFGNGVEVEVLNEGGGREVILFNELDAQFAHLLCLHRHRPQLIEKLTAIAEAQVETARSGRGTIGAGAVIASVGEIVNVNIGAYARVKGASLLRNGTILSSEEAPTVVGAGVQAEDFIIAEGSEVSGGAIISSSYVGQGCRIGKQFSAEASLFFANCEGFHGEACSVFAGPYTVTHHKSTLLIAALFSFYNAGSGTNQSNHMYKLGPVHEGKLERGTKTGSFSYMMWPCRVGPFSVVLGKHTRNFDTAQFPFSFIEATSQGRCTMVPGLNLSTVGTVRDGAKWPARDRRKGSVKRDRISFDVFSPLTVGRMISASAKLKELHEATPRTVDAVTVNGAEIKRVLLRSGQKFYRAGIHMYLLDKVVGHVEAALAGGAATTAAALASAPGAVYSEQWVDIGGQMMARQRLTDLCDAVEGGAIADLAGFNAACDRIAAAYDDDEWVWVKRAFQTVFDVDLDAAGADGLEKIAADLLVVQGKFLRLILIDAGKEFDDVTKTGFGQDSPPEGPPEAGGAEDAVADFVAVRGEYAANKFVKEIQQTIADLETRVDKFKQQVRR